MLSRDQRPSSNMPMSLIRLEAITWVCSLLVCLMHQWLLMVYQKDTRLTWLVTNGAFRFSLFGPSVPFMTPMLGNVDVSRRDASGGGANLTVGSEVVMVARR